MDIKKFEKEYYSEFFKPSPKYELAFQLWVEYLYYTEEYDRKVCTGFNNTTSEAVPVNGYEMKLTYKNARDSFHRVNEILLLNKVDEDTSERAKSEALRYSHEQLKRWIEKWKENSDKTDV